MEKPKGVKLIHEDRIIYSNLLRSLFFDTMGKKEEKLWQTGVWGIQWPELSKFLSDPDSTYGQSWDDYLKIMQQFQSVQRHFPGLKKAYLFYMCYHERGLGIEKRPSPWLIAGIVISGLALVYFLL